MIRIAILSAVTLLLFTACERQQESPAEISRQTTPTPVAPTPAESPAATIDPAQVQVPPRGEVSLETGQQVYQSSCASCHDQGVAGAPVRGNQEQWAARLEKGYEALVTSSINGYTGEMGVMPPRGGNPNLSDEEVAAAVAYMMEMSP
ncbi:MAG: cytochrome c5 family protein [Desulfuromonadales bacterium]|nr:cytochrome c5 family protein [Desulfuromonadales bacterium]